MTKARLGRGLDALLGEGEPKGATPGGTSAQVPVGMIEGNPQQPRKAFDEDEMEALAGSIKNHGILQPIVVRQVGDRYQVVAGERRLRAARAAGLATVPVTVVDFNDQEVLEAALVENLQRADLNPIEKAQGFKDYLTRYKMTHDQLAARLGLGRATITNLVALLDLPGPIQEAIRVGQLSTGHAKILKGVTDPEKQQSLFKEIVARGLSVHATEALVKQSANVPEPEAAYKDPGGPGVPPAEGKASDGKTAHVQSIEDDLRKKLGLRVEIRVKGKDRGQFILSFESNDDFERLVEALGR